jgi:hypothetical protein
VRRRWQRGDRRGPSWRRGYELLDRHGQASAKHTEKPKVVLTL